MNDYNKEETSTSSQGAEEKLFFGDNEENREVLVEMAKSGVLYGHKKFRKNPRFAEYVYSVRNGLEIIDLSKTLKALDIVANYLKQSKADKKTIMVVATQPAAHAAAKNLAAALDNCLCVTNKWIGGLITNFSILSKRIDHYKKLIKDMDEGKYDAYTKKEKLLISRQIEKMRIMFEGLDNYTHIPDVMFIVDSCQGSHKTAVREALLKKISLVGIIDSDDNPDIFTYFIPANDHAKASIEWVTNRLISKITEA